MARFQHFLVPVDFTDKNEAALQTARDLAAAADGRMTLLHVIELIGDELDPELAEFYERLQRRASDELRALEKRLIRLGIETTTEIRIGRRVPEIVGFAAENEVDLIVLSSHRIERDQPVRSLGTISYQVSILCECAVMLVK
ncbi:MAG: universal stress protein [Planctomycetaceae bacterium]